MAENSSKEVEIDGGRLEKRMLRNWWQMNANSQLFWQFLVSRSNKSREPQAIQCPYWILQESTIVHGPGICVSLSLRRLPLIEANLLLSPHWVSLVFRSNPSTLHLHPLRRDSSISKDIFISHHEYFNDENGGKPKDLRQAIKVIKCQKSELMSDLRTKVFANKS